MKRRWLLLNALAAAVVLGGCATNSELTPKEREKIEREQERQAQKQSQAEARRMRQTNQDGFGRTSPMRR